MTGPVLLWGIATDGPLAAVRHVLACAGVPTVFVDQHAAASSAISLEIGEGVSGILATAAGEVALESVEAVYIRPYDLRQVIAAAGVAADSAAWTRALAFEDTLACWIEMTDALVINPQWAMASNNSKPYQSRLIARSGFAVPDTMVTTDPAAAVEFWRRHGTVVYKSLSGIRSIVSRLHENDLSRVGDVANCPTQFQEYVDGTDVRVHVVGGEIFACEVRSGADDYRYPDRTGATVDIAACALPEGVSRRCRALAQSLALPVAGIDLRRTPTGAWYCFEVNPSPGFTYFEAETGAPIGAAIARLLAAGRAGRALLSARQAAPTSGPTSDPDKGAARLA